MDAPPADTRAYFRGECLRRYPAQVAAASWDSVIFDLGRESLVRVPTLEPLRGTRAHVGALLDRCDGQELVDTSPAADRGSGAGCPRGSSRPVRQTGGPWPPGPGGQQGTRRARSRRGRGRSTPRSPSARNDRGRRSIRRDRRGSSRREDSAASQKAGRTAPRPTRPTRPRPRAESDRPDVQRAAREKLLRGRRRASSTRSTRSSRRTPRSSSGLRPEGRRVARLRRVRTPAGVLTAGSCTARRRRSGRRRRADGRARCAICREAPAEHVDHDHRHR